MARIQTFKGNVNYSELIDSHKYSYIGQVAKLTRDFKVTWEDRYAFMTAMLGSAVLQNIGTPSPSIKRYFPKGYTDYFNTQKVEPFLYPTSIELVEGMAVRSAPITGRTERGIPSTDDRSEDPHLFKNARVRIGYEALTYQVEGEYNGALLVTPGVDEPLVKASIADNKRYITKVIQPMLEVIRLPVGYYQWAEGYQDGSGRVVAKPKVTNTTGFYRVKSTAEITYTWHMVPGLSKEGWYKEDISGFTGEPDTPELVGSLFTHLGCLNHNWFDGYAPGTLLLKGAEAKPYKWVDGRRYYDYTWHVQHFEPVDPLKAGASILRDNIPVTPNVYTTRPLTSKPGHNYFLRLQFPLKDPTTGALQPILPCEPHYELLTDTGFKNGKPVFAYRDFNDLFIPMNKRHMLDYYSTYDLNPEL